MDLSSVDENGNSFFASAKVTSTPKAPKNRKQYICPHCNKVYVVKHYYDLHVQSHLSQGQSDKSQTVHLDASLDQSLNLSGRQLFRVPAQPKKKQTTNKKSAKPKPTLICTYCLKPYVDSRSFKTHMRSHTMQDAATRFPDIDEIIDNIPDISSATLITVSSCPSYGDSGQHFRNLVGHAISESKKYLQFSTKFGTDLCSSIANKKCLLPSALLNTLFDKVEQMVSNNDYCDAALDLLDGSSFSKNAQCQFMTEFSFSFTLEIFKFISKTFRSHYRSARRPMPQLDLEDRQVIYHIGGSIMKGYFRIAYRNKGNSKWQTITKVLKSQVLANGPVGDIDAEWTKQLDRGGLLYILEPVQQFLIKLTEVVFFSFEKGSISYEKVLSKVTNSDVSVQWDSLINNHLPEDLSVGLMNDVIEMFCKACGRGTAKRMLNRIREKPLISMPTRHAAASRKKK